MSEHFTSNTVSASFWCPKCKKFTQHRIDGHRKGPCLECIAKADVQHEAQSHFEAFRPSREISEFGKRALDAGIQVKVRKGIEFVYVNDATYAYLTSEHAVVEISLVCSCPQRPYPHELSVHAEIRSEWWAHKRNLSWPWSLMASSREEPSTERKRA